ncbi:LysR family transcriptional regulator [Neisseria perflava]|uniref:LysR family transcriptional regulator n=1 Tax=Neisseria perflava TaxID=33053 RepID=UPI0020A1AD2F|nr:LysR family transcriptional regulator [Neisseria perflava]MCP1661248.1 DNA-binding transcriptional LysR family regulator [Neisseria perflava]MCP1772258.1 DNA-binding transcriptional LysR family regulator [Neisseria perflava]
MNTINRLDLNLLPVLQVLLEERHVSRSAERLFKSQPALSHALAQLREQFNDPLLVRQNGKMQLTSFADGLQAPLAQLLADLDRLLGGEPFSPAECERTFRIAMSDYAASVILSPLLRRLRRHAPNIRLVINQPPSRESLLNQLMDGEIDLAFGVLGDIPHDIQSQWLFDEQFVCITDRSNCYQHCDTTQWAALPHIVLSLQPQANEELEKALLQQNLSLNRQLVSPHWNAALDLLAGTDLLLTVSSKMADKLQHHPQLHTFPPPLKLPAIPYLQLWHSRRTQDKGLTWLREQVAGLFALGED